MAASCPICFEEATEEDGEAERFLIRGKYCKHGFCKPCLDKILLLLGDDADPAGAAPSLEEGGADNPLGLSRHPRQFQPSEQDDDDGGGGFGGGRSERRRRDPSDVAMVGIPTQGSCPVCRSRLSVFDLRWVREGGDDDDNEDEDNGKKDSREEEDDAAVANHPYHDEIVTDWRETPLVGKVYAGRYGVGSGSYHFDPNNGIRVPGGHPYWDSSQYPQQSGNILADDSADNAAVQGKLPLLGFKWHGPSRTMLASIVPPQAGRDRRDTNEVIVSFSQDLYHFRAAALVHRWTEFDSAEDLQRAFPLDGTYRVLLAKPPPQHSAPPRAAAAPPEAETHVVAGNRVRSMARYHEASLDRDGGRITIVCVERAERGSDELNRVAPWDFDGRPLGPAAGETVRFDLPGLGPDAHEEWTVLEKAAAAPPSDVMYFGPEIAPDTYYRRWGAVEKVPPVVPRWNSNSRNRSPATLWGNVFCVKAGVGMESFHFAAPSVGDDHEIAAYIMYADSALGMLPKMGDGWALPERACFRNASYDASSRTFVGTVEWLRDYGTTHLNMNKWKFKMKFDSEFACILSGNLRGYEANNSGGVGGGGQRGGKVMFVFGRDQFYFNAALEEHFCDLLEVDRRQVLGGPPYSAALRRAAGILRFQLQGPDTAAAVLARAQPLLERLTREGAKAQILTEVRQLWVAMCMRVSCVGVAGL
jgi:Zinc finger, C3HC4 type (RING finger)